MHFSIKSLIAMLAITSLEAAGSEYPIIAKDKTEFFSVGLKDLELSLPLKIKEGIQFRTTDNTQTVGTDNFMIEFKSLNYTTGKDETKQYIADIQTTVTTCDPEERAANLQKNFGSNSGRDFTIDYVKNESFDGYRYFAEDYKRSDKNIIIGAVNQLNHDCYSTSLAVYGVGDMKEPVFRRMIKVVFDGLSGSYEELTKNQ